MGERLHVWVAVDGYPGRYRCSGCGVFGLKERTVTDGARGSADIRPYKCYKCGEPAIAKETHRESGMGTKEWRCPAHRAPWVKRQAAAKR